MINGYSIRKCAKIVEISIPTSFYWRHKILDAKERYGRTGFMYNVNSPKNPETGEMYGTCFGAIKKYK